MSNYSIVTKQYVESVLAFLEPLLPLANCHMVDYFTKNVYSNILPQNLQEEISSSGHAATIKTIFTSDYSKHPVLNDYIAKTKTLTLYNWEGCLSLNAFYERLKVSEKGLKLEVFMSTKKSHEVEILSTVSAAIKQVSNTTHLIDVGDGKGYLSSMLALHFKLPVLGVDASEINTSGAIERTRKLTRVWRTLAPQSDSPKSDLYKQVTQYVDENLDLSELVRNVFCTTVIPNRLGLIGLHTCGDLSTTSLKIYNKNNNIKTLCNVGCCYHLLTERFEANSTPKGGGFPLSDNLNSRRFSLGRKARMIGAQSVERILQKQILPNDTLFYRALFEVILCEHVKKNGSEDYKVGRFRKPCKSFLDYVRKSTVKLGLTLELTDDEVCDYYVKYKDCQDELHLFYLIRSMLAPVVESLILADRLLFLLEKGHEQSYLVQLFDPVISPRCYGVVSIKNN